jgi:transposase
VNGTPAVEPGGTEIVSIQFSTTDCRECPERSRCPRSDRRSLTVRRRAGFEALKAARDRESTAEYRAEYARRTGIEGTISQGARAFGLRNCRYIGGANSWDLKTWSASVSTENRPSCVCWISFS